jgi:hypothetical protein
MMSKKKKLEQRTEILRCAQDARAERARMNVLQHKVTSLVMMSAMKNLDQGMEILRFAQYDVQMQQVPQSRVIEWHL